MAKQEPTPEAGKRQPQKPDTLDKASGQDLAAGIRQKAKSGDKDERAVANAVSDLDGAD
jgi:hypothetical protein